MDISATLMKNYSQSIAPDTTNNTDTILYGVVSVVSDDDIYVRYDNSIIDTPVASTVDVSPNDRVMVLLKKHTATIIGNLTTPTDQTLASYSKLRDYFVLTSDIESEPWSIGYAIMDHDTRHVNIYFNYTFLDYVQINIPLLHIPIDYAPAKDQIFEIIVDMGDLSYAKGYSILRNNGIITQDISNKCIGITGHIEYTI